MATKSWKLGELSKGGVITVTTSKNTVLVRLKSGMLQKGLAKVATKAKRKSGIELK